MKKTLTAICATFLLAAPIQIASAASNTSEVTPVKQISIEQATKYITYNYQGLDKNWTVKKEDLEALIKYTQELVQNKVAETKPATPVKTEEKVTLAQPATPAKTEEKVTPAQPAAPVKTEEKVTPAQPATPAKTQDKVTSTKPTTTTSTSDVSAFEQQVVELTNAERTKAGLAPLQTDTKLMAAAREKSQDMQTNKYFSHTSPTFGSPFDRMKALGISYKTAGENIAQGQQTPQEVVQAWMDSPGHRANILSADFTHIGVGYVKSGNYWTQQFIKK